MRSSNGTGGKQGCDTQRYECHCALAERMKPLTQLKSLKLQGYNEVDDESLAVLATFPRCSANSTSTALP